MPISSFSGLQTSLRGLLAEQRALDVTSHNISNANTVGYSRQEALRSTSLPTVLPGGALPDGRGAQLGTGVEVQAYRRVRDGFLDLQYRAQTMRVGEMTTRLRSLDQAELALAEPSESGLAATLDKFWNAWADVANAPESLAARQALVDQGGVLAGSISQLDAQLATVGAQASAAYVDETGPQGQVALLARDLAELNGAIATAVSARQEPNDLLDRRDVLLDRLAGLAQVTTAEVLDPSGRPTGAIAVAFGDADQPLVNGTTVNWPQTLTNPQGRLGALLELARPGGTIASYRADLNAMAGGLADAVNGLHGTSFFTYTPGSEAASLRVAVGTAGVRTSTSPNPGANDLASRIAALRDGASDGAYSALVARIGNDVRDTQRREANATTLADAVEDRRQSTSGVAMDEEMTNLIRYQRSYQASARVMSTLDDALDTLINRTGRVGL